MEGSSFRLRIIVLLPGRRHLKPSSLLKKCVYAKMTVVFPCGLVL